MAYEGNYIDKCLDFNFRQTRAIVVSGASWNPCGHLLLNVGGSDGWYFHVAGKAIDRPKFMNANGYRRYIMENKKKNCLELMSTYLVLMIQTQNLKNS